MVGSLGLSRKKKQLCRRFQVGFGSDQVNPGLGATFRSLFRLAGRIWVRGVRFGSWELGQFCQLYMHGKSTNMTLFGGGGVDTYYLFDNLCGIW